MKQIDKLIINAPYEEPKYYWHYDREHRSFEKREGRRPAGYVVATPDSRGFDDPGVFVPIELVNKIRPRVKAWRENDYPGVSGITRRLLHHWQDPVEREIRRFFFCQLETKGQDSDLARTKRAYLQEWVMAVNNHGGFGTWHEAVSFNPNDLSEILKNIR